MSRDTSLLATSCHAPHVICNLPVGELLRTKKTCSNPDKLLVYQNDVRNKLLVRQCPGWRIDRALHKTALIPRESLFTSKNKCRPLEKEQLVTFTTPYSRQYNQIVSQNGNIFPILSIQDQIRNTVETGGRFVSTKAPTRVLFFHLVCILPLIEIAIGFLLQDLYCL